MSRSSPHDRQADELERAHYELARCQLEFDEFVYVVSHDLKEPLRGIAHYARFVLEDAGHLVDEASRQKLAALPQLADQMTAMIDALAEYSRAGRGDLSIADVDLNGIVGEVLDELKDALEQGPVEVRIPRPLPVVPCDRRSVQIIFQKLLDNALRYNDKPHRWIQIGYEPHDATRPLEFYVRDNGIGIPEKHFDSVFRIFRRLHAKDARGGGAGAGLTTARRLVERHGGSIRAESTLGEGATVCFTLAPVGAAE
ncbi:MAG: hypothetical protein KY476_09065 [Planctomycetes bacterium]|nr:hypothetical protein [Planctomycetota bacterium]